MKLNIHLFQEDVKKFADCLRPLTDKRRYKSIGAGDLGAGMKHQIHVTDSPGKMPPWVEVLREYAEEGTLERVRNLSHGALVLFRASTSSGIRFFAVTYGVGHNLVNRDRTVLGFGLRAALNAVDPDKLNLMDSRDVQFQTRQKRVASSASGTLGALDFEADAEILRIVGGQCADKGFGRRVEGSDSLHVTVSDLKLEDIGKKCVALHDLYQKDTYKERFGFVDHIGLVRSAGLKQRLEDELARALEAERTDGKIAIVCPDQIDQRDCVSYQMTGLRGTVVSEGDIPLSSLYDYLRASKNGRGIGREHLRKVRIVGLDEDGALRTSNQPLLAYLVYEAVLDGRRYVLSNEKWYRVDNAYLQGVEAKLRAVPRCENPTILSWPKVQRGPSWMHHEEDYNKQYEKKKDFLVLDRKPFRKFGAKHGHSQVEIADLFHLPTKRLLCVKRWNGSSTMSHLLAQASVSAQLLRNLPEYARELMRQVKERWPAHALPADPKEFLHGISFVYVIGTEDSREHWSLDALPVFTKVNLVRHIGIIEGRGFDVQVGWAQMV